MNPNSSQRMSVDNRPAAVRAAAAAAVEALEARRLMAGDVVISEFLADNQNALADQDGTFSDWIELTNRGDAPVNLAGWRLTDDPADFWTLPARTLAPGEFLVVFASGKDRAPAAGELHTDFSLSANGEYLALVRPDGSFASLYNPYPRQRPDVSYGTGQEIVPGALVSAGSPARVRVPTANSNTWTGAAANEPFNDSAAAGWIQGAVGVGFDTAPTTGENNEVVGNALVARPITDIAVGSIYLLESAPFAQPGTIGEWSIYAGATGRSITPLILQRDAAGEYTVTGVGQSRAISTVGALTFGFALQSGSTTVGPEYYFGWRDGTATTGNAGVAPFTENAGQSVREFGQRPTVAAGDFLGGAGRQFTRTYSVQAKSVISGAPQPKGYWNFDDDVLDASGNGHHAANNGAVFSATVPPALGGGKSLNFDGVNDYVSARIDVSESAYTSSMWFKADAGGRGLFAVVDGDLGAGGHDRHVYLSGGNIGVRTWSNEVLTTAGRNYADGQWHHVAHVVGAAVGGQRVYVDGQQVLSGTKAFSDFNWQKTVNIGFSNDAPSGGFFDGLIDDVAVYDAALGEAHVRALAQGASPLALAGLAPSISTDVRAAMHNVNPSAYVRMPFTVANPAASNGLVLRMKYEDGFVAYLNGVEVARRNAPAGAPAYNAASVADRPKGLAAEYEEIDISAAAGLLRGGTNVLAVQGLNSSAASGDFLISPQLVQVRNTPNRYLNPATPGEANVAGVLDFVADPTFSVDRGFFTAAFNVTVTAPTPGATLVYTTDGSTPTLTNGTQVQPPSGTTAPTVSIPVNTTTPLRAAAFKSGWQTSAIGTQTYIFPAAVANQPAAPAGFPTTWAGGYPADYQVDPDVVNTTLPGYSFNDALLAIPTISIVTDRAHLFDPGTGIYYNTDFRGRGGERPASVELIDPGGGSREFQIDAGIRMHGNSSRYHGFTPKHPIRLHFRREYGDGKLDFPLFADSFVNEFDELLLRGSSTDSWPVVEGNDVMGVRRWTPTRATYLRDQWMRDAQNAMGHPSPHGTYVHLYIDGLYWGQYNLAERAKDDWNASYFGGSEEDYDVLKDFAELDAGTADAWNQMISLASQGLGTDAAYNRIQGRNPDGTRNVDLPNYLDVDALIDYMILHIYAGAEDWPDHNWWAARKRGPDSEGFKFFAWDQEISNDSLERQYTRISTRFEDPIGSPSPSYLYGQLSANATFRQQFIDRVHEHLFNGGLLTTAKNQQRWLARANEIDKSIVAESARWGDTQRATPFKRETDWLAMSNWTLNTYFPQIHEVALNRFRARGLYPTVVAPTFSQHGGTVSPGYSLTMSAPAGSIYYTLDGSDPKRPDGSLSPSARLYSGATAINGNGPVKARVRNGTSWSALTAASFAITGQTVADNLRVSEVMYHPAAPAGGLTDGQEFEFVELQNVGSQPINLRGVRLTGGAGFTFNDDVTLAAGQYGVLVRDADALTARYGTGINILGTYLGGLNNDTDTLTLLAAGGQAIQTFSYDDAWHPTTDGDGPSLVKLDPATSPTSTWGQASGWRASTTAGGSPGGPDGGTPANATVTGRRIFYNRSAYDGMSDDGAIAPGKTGLLPGGTATSAHYTSYSKGINGVMIDVAGMTATALQTSDFSFRVGNSNNLGSWTLAPDPTMITVRKGAGANGADRVVLVWADNVIRKTWLQVTMLATTDTRLLSPDVFYVGNAIGDTFNSATTFKVDSQDVTRTRNAQNRPTTLLGLYDHNRDGKVNTLDQTIARNGQGFTLTRITAPGVAPAAAPASGSSTSTVQPAAAPQDKEATAAGAPPAAPMPVTPVPVPPAGGPAPPSTEKSRLSRAIRSLLELQG